MNAALSTKHTPVTKQIAVSIVVLAALLLSIQAAHAQSKPVLPKCNMDSFVYNSAGNAENIYGDEGWRGPPPFNGFTVAHRLSTGFAPEAQAGLTTGHGSYMPRAWGGDEWTGNEWSQSGPTGGNNGGWNGGNNGNNGGNNGNNGGNNGNNGGNGGNNGGTNGATNPESNFQSAPAFDTTSMNSDAPSAATDTDNEQLTSWNSKKN